MTKIAHISDVHFRSLKRHDEYKSIFQKIFDTLKIEKVDMIFIGGDIVHSKTQGITPEIIDVLNWWFTSLASIAPTHVILGNHDGLILNKDRQDAITPIVNALNNKNLFLYKDSGVYASTVEGINWCVFSCFDQENWNKVKPIKEDLNIACYHGAVFGSKTDVDWYLDGEVNKTMFEDFDFTFLGDIHKYQYLDDEKRIAYPGSAVQQNYGEDIKKGFLIWEINNKNDYTSKLVTFDNPYPFVTIDWKGSVANTIKFCDKIRNKCRFRIRSKEEISQAEIKLLHHYLKNDKKAYEIVYQTLPQKNIFQNTEIKKQEKSFNVRSREDRENLIKNFYPDITKENYEKLDCLFTQKIDEIPSSLNENNNKWSINYLKFDNTFSYGKNNQINFDNLNGVVGIFGNNRAGKSSIPGTLMYTLFNTSDRGSLKNKDIVNIRKGKCKSTVGLTTNQGSYEVTRETIKKTNKAGITNSTTKLYLNSYNNLGEEIDESEEQRRETDKILKKIVGSAEDFLYTSFASQGEINTFVKEKTSARKTVLTKFLSLEIYDELYKNSREEYIVLKNKLKNLQEKNWDNVILDLEKQKLDFQNEIPFLEDKIVKLREKELSLKVKQSEIEGTNKHHTGYDLNTASLKLKNLENLLEETSCKIRKNVDILQINEEKTKKITSFKKSYSIEELNNDKDKLDLMLNKIKIFKKDKSLLNKNKDNALREIKILDQVPCGSQYPKCKFITKAFESKENIPQLDKKLEDIEVSIYEIKNVVSKLESENINESIKKYNDVLNKEYRLTVDSQNLKKENNFLREKTIDINENIAKIHKIIEEIKCIDSSLNLKDLDNIESNLNEIRYEILEKERKLRKNRQSIFEISEKIIINSKEKSEYYKIIDEWKIYDMFSLAVSKKGIPTLLINSCLPKINKEISLILNNVTNFNIEIIEENNSINVYIDYGDSKRIIECGSGMEKMMASIAIRTALVNISLLPKSDIFIIDEGFGALDETNIEACGRLLRSLKKYFKSIIIISHVDAIKDIVDKNIEITVKDNDAYVLST